MLLFLLVFFIAPRKIYYKTINVCLYFVINTSNYHTFVLWNLSLQPVILSYWLYSVFIFKLQDTKMLTCNFCFMHINFIKFLPSPSKKHNHILRCWILVKIYLFQKDGSLLLRTFIKNKNKQSKY